MAYEVRVPRLGWSMEEGTFVRWLKQPGDVVAAGDLLFEIEGEKALQEVESIDAGTLYIPPDAPQPGSTVAVGAVLGYLLAPGEAAPAPSPAAGQPEAAGPPADKADANNGNGSSAALPAAGPAVRRLARELGVDLADVTPSDKSGRISRADVEVVAEGKRRFSSTADTTATAEPSTSASRPIATPRARRVARELGVDWTVLQGTGRHGRIRAADVHRQPVEAARPSAASDQSPLRPAARMSPRRQAIANRLRASRDLTVPVTLTTTADVTNLVALREQFRSHPSGVVPTYADVIGCLVARVLRRHAQLAVRWDDAHTALMPIDAEAIHVGIAVDTPDGLLVPVVRDVLGKSLLSVAEESKLLAERARSGRLRAGDMQDAAITISNLGAYGIDAFTPVINDPQVVILGLGAIRREPVVLADERIVARQRMTLSLTFDHAAVDGAPAAAFLQDVSAALENAAAYLLGE